jgi:hypothetical protein
VTRDTVTDLDSESKTHAAAAVSSVRIRRILSPRLSLRPWVVHMHKLPSHCALVEDIPPVGPSTSIWMHFGPKVPLRQYTCQELKHM